MSASIVFRLPALCLIAVVMAAVVTPAAAEVYRWVDDQGQVHFSDEPRDGAEPIDVGEPTVVESLPIPEGADPKDDAASGSGPGTDDDAAVAQTPWRIAIAAPSDEATVRDNQGKVQVVLNVRPRFSEDHRILILVDGSPYREGPFTSTDVTLSGIDRGAHELQALLRDDSGRVLARSSTVTVYVHQASRLFRNR